MFGFKRKQRLSHAEKKFYFIYHCLVSRLVSILSAIGTSKSGKTTLIEYLVSHLSKEGLKIGTIKHVHHANFSIDSKGKDTWRHSKAGAEVVVCIAPREIAIIKKRRDTNETLEQIIDILKGENLDLIIIEGFHSLISKRPDICKIITAKDEKDLMRTLRGTVDPVLAITGQLTKKKLELKKLKIPLIDLDANGDEILNIVKQVIHNTMNQVLIYTNSGPKE